LTRLNTESAPDAAGNLPDGTQAGHPAGSFPHIPTYAIGCTLEQLAGASNGRMKLEVAGRSVQDRPLYLVTIDARETEAQRLASLTLGAPASFGRSRPVWRARTRRRRRRT
jgi:hypothetical protein